LNLPSLLANPITQSILAICTIGSILVSIYLYLVSKREKNLVYDYSRVRYISNEKKGNLDSKLELFYDGKKIENYSVYVFCIFNKGKEPIRKNDIPEKDPISIKNKENSILIAEIIYKTSDKNDIKIERKLFGYEITFEFLEYGDGIILQVISEHSVEFSGSIIGQRILNRSKISDPKIISSFFSVISISIFGLFSNFLLIPIIKPITKNFSIFLSLTSFALFYIGMILFVIYFSLQATKLIILRSPKIINKFCNETKEI
jgi:hypothetical protein